MNKVVTVFVVLVCLAVVLMVLLIPRDGLNIGAVYGGF